MHQTAKTNEQTNKTPKTHTGLQLQKLVATSRGQTFKFAI